MTGEQYLRALRDHWRIVVAAVLVGIVLAIGALLVVPKKYSASVDAFVLPSGAAPDATSAYQGGLLSEQRVKSYVQLFQGGRVSDLVIERLRLPLTSEQLTKKVTVSSQTDTVILTISVVDSTPEGARGLADATAAAFRDLVAQLEQPPDPRIPSATSIKIVAPARLADGAVSPEPPLYLAAGGALGLLMGLVLAIRRDARGRPVRSAEDLAATLGVPSFGIVLERDTASGPPLAALDRASPDTEAFRQIRTGLQFADVDHAHKVVVVTSANEGDGKTTTVCNLAAVLAAAGHSVLLVDADLRRPGAGQLLDLEQGVGLTTLLRGRLTIADAVQAHPGGFDVLASGPLPPNPSELTASDAMNAVFLQARERYEYVLVDTAPLLPVTDTAALAGLADGVVLVCRFGATLDSEVRQAAATLRTVRASIWGTVLSFVPRRAAGSRKYGTYGLATSRTGSFAAPTPHRRSAPPTRGRPGSGAPPPALDERTETLQPRRTPSPGPAPRPPGRHR